MSRMLEALKQIEAKSPRLQEALQSRPPRRSRQRVADETADAPPDDRGVSPNESIRDDSAIEETLSKAEDAAATAGRTDVEPSPPTVSPPQTEAVESVADGAFPDEPATEASDSASVHWPRGPSEEHARAYGELAENILAQLSPGRSAVLMFTSPGDGEVKTEMLIPLAAALAQQSTGEVLLVDGNLREPALAGYLGMEATAGLANVLLGTMNWQQVVRHTVIPRLSMLPGAKLPVSHGDAPEQWNLRPLLEELRSEYRLVLIDASSLAHGEVAPMGSDCDGTYLVVRVNHTSGRAVRDCLRVIEACGGHLLGSIAIGG